MYKKVLIKKTKFRRCVNLRSALVTKYDYDVFNINNINIHFYSLTMFY